MEKQKIRVRNRNGKEGILEVIPEKLVVKDGTFVYRPSKQNHEMKPLLARSEWVLVDINTGLSIAYGKTRIAMISKYFQREEKYEKIKNTPFYEEKTKQFKILKGE